MNHDLNCQILLCFSVEGTWSVWQNWGGCSSTCGLGTRTRIKSHIGGRRPCQGQPMETENCQGKIWAFSIWYFNKFIACINDLGRLMVEHSVPYVTLQIFILVRTLKIIKKMSLFKMSESWFWSSVFSWRFLVKLGIMGIMFNQLWSRD